MKQKDIAKELNHSTSALQRRKCDAKMQSPYKSSNSKRSPKTSNDFKRPQRTSKDASKIDKPNSKKAKTKNNSKGGDPHEMMLTLVMEKILLNNLFQTQ